MSGDRPKLISAPTSFSQGVARTDMKTWGVMGILLVIAIAAVMLLGVFHEKQPMFGNAPFGQAPPQQQQQPQSERLREIPVVRPGELPPPPPPPG
jgi:hypothetical protein